MRESEDLMGAARVTVEDALDECLRHRVFRLGKDQISDQRFPGRVCMEKDEEKTNDFNRL